MPSSTQTPQVEISPEKLYVNAPLVLGKLAELSQLILRQWKDAPPLIKAKAGDAVALIVKLSKTPVLSDECVVKLETPNERRPKVTQAIRDAVRRPEAVGAGQGRALQSDRPIRVEGEKVLRTPLRDSVKGPTPLSRSPANIRSSIGTPGGSKAVPGQPGGRVPNRVGDGGAAKRDSQRVADGAGDDGDSH